MIPPIWKMSGAGYAALGQGTRLCFLKYSEDEVVWSRGTLRMSSNSKTRPGSSYP